MQRREFLKFSLASAAALGLQFYLAPAYSQAAGSRSKKMILVFLRGGADSLSLFPPRLDHLRALGTAERRNYANHPLYNFRGKSDPQCEKFLFGTTEFPFGMQPGNIDASKLAVDIPGHPCLFHPALAPLFDVIRTDNYAVMLHTGSTHQSRSHFDQMDFMESGSNKGKYSTGFLARFASILNRTPIALGDAPPTSLRGIDVPVLSDAKDAKSALTLGNGRVRIESLSRDERLEIMSPISTADINCESSAYCKTINAAKSQYAQLEQDLNAYTPLSGTEFVKACNLAAKLTHSTFDPPVMTLDYKGWDTHFTQDPKMDASAFYKKVGDLADGLRQLYDNMSAETVVVVVSEFGRTMEANRSMGTDHGHGSAMMVLGQPVSRQRIVNAPTGWDFSQLDGSGSSAALNVNIDFREIIGEVMHRHLGIALTTETPLTSGTVRTIFDGLTDYRRRNFIA